MLGGSISEILGYDDNALATGANAAQSSATAKSRARKGRGGKDLEPILRDGFTESHWRGRSLVPSRHTARSRSVSTNERSKDGWPLRIASFAIRRFNRFVRLPHTHGLLLPIIFPHPPNTACGTARAAFLVIFAADTPS